MRRELLTWSERGQLWFRLGLRIILFVLACVILVKLAPPLWSLFAPFIVALIMALLLNPVVRWVQRRLGWNRRLLSLLVLILLFTLLGGVLFLLVYGAGSELISLAQNWTSLLENAQAIADQIELFMARFFSLVPDQITQLLETASDNVMNWLQGAAYDGLIAVANVFKEKAVQLPAFLLSLIMFIIASYFITADYPYLRTRAIQHTDERLLHFLKQVRSTALAAFGGYLRAEMLLSVGVFVILAVGFYLIGQNYALLLALGLAVMDFIPIIGSGTIMVPWAFVALFTRDYSTAIGLMVIWGIVVLFRRVAEPKFVGNQTGLSPLLSLISIYVGMKLGGVLGMILGPILALVVINLAGLGIFSGIRADITTAVWDIAAVLRQRTEP